MHSEVNGSRAAQAGHHAEPPPSNQRYRPGLDGLRALAILPVIVFHLKERWFPGGFIGVDVFFVISGFLITNGILNDLRRGDFSLGRFYQRRIARLFPTIALVLSMTVVGMLLVYDRAFVGFNGPHVAAAVGSVVNLLLAHESNYFALSRDAYPLLHFWSLSVEEQFYLLFPMLTMLLFRWRQRWVRPAIAIVLLASLLLCIRETRTDPTAAFYLLPTRAWELLTGALVATWAGERRFASGRWRAGFAFAGILLLVVAYAVVRSAQFPGAIAMLPAAASALLIRGVSGSVKGGSPDAPNPVERLLSWRPLVYTGQMSYVLYLWHLPLFCFVDYHMLLVSEWKRTVLKLSLTVALSVATAYLVENPARWWLNRRENRSRAYALALITVCTFVTVGAALRLYGWPEPRDWQVKRGGIEFHRDAKGGTVALIGDSLACASATTLRSITEQKGMRFASLCMSARRPLVGVPGAAWPDTLAGVERLRPDLLVLEYTWLDAPGSRAALEDTIAALQPYTRTMVFVSHYPMLEGSMPREGLRDGVKQPVFEAGYKKTAREAGNALMQSVAAEHGYTVVDTVPGFMNPDGSVRVLDAAGKPMYLDWMHASRVGVTTFRAQLADAISLKH